MGAFFPLVVSLYLFLLQHRPSFILHEFFYSTEFWLLFMMEKWYVNWKIIPLRFAIYLQQKIIVFIQYWKMPGHWIQYTFILCSISNTTLSYVLNSTEKFIGFIHENKLWMRCYALVGLKKGIVFGAYLDSTWKLCVSVCVVFIRLSVCLSVFMIVWMRLFYKTKRLQF